LGFEEELTGKIRGFRGAGVGALALTRIFTGQLKISYKARLIVRDLELVCM
jgi:hypothetical protein